ncbi:MAG: aminopeptidase [Leptospiraceae bacterium]|nr:aminopeptidase [Leptospiraceae bacterium]
MSTERKGDSWVSSASRRRTRPRYIRWTLLGAIPALLLFVAGFSSCVTGSPLYLWGAASGQVSILCARKPISDVLLNPDLEPETRRKLELVLKVQDFARSQLHLDTGSSYKYFSRIDRDAAAYNVVAAESLALKAHTYWFPIVGTVPYLGFFSREEASQHADSLRQEGLDVLVQDVAGYSTLGWFDDPLLSSQLQYSDYGLVRLVIHEAVHATVWIPGSVTFNESLASFVEEKGADQYVRSQDPDGSRMRRILKYRAESQDYRRLLRQTAAELEKMYQSTESDEEKLRKKARIIGNLREIVRRQPWQVLSPSELADKDYNNAFFLSYLTYNTGNPYFEAVFGNCAQDWTCFLNRMKSLDAPPEDWSSPGE